MSKAFIPSGNDNQRAVSQGGPGAVPTSHRPPRVDQQPSAGDLLKTGSSKQVDAQPESNHSADSSALYSEAGQLGSQGPGLGNFVAPEASKSGDSTNKSKGKGVTSGFPAAGGGGGGGLVTKPGVIGQTLATRPTRNPGGFGSSK